MICTRICNMIFAFVPDSTKIKEFPPQNLTKSLFRCSRCVHYRSTLILLLIIIRYDTVHHRFAFGVLKREIGIDETRFGWGRTWSVCGALGWLSWRWRWSSALLLMLLAMASPGLLIEPGRLNGNFELLASIRFIISVHILCLCVKREIAEFVGMENRFLTMV